MSKAHFPPPEAAVWLADMPTSERRFRAYRLIDAKLTGDKWAQALSFVHGTRKGSAIERLCERLETLPDVPRTVAASSRLSAAQVKAIREARSAGAKAAELAERFGISISSVYRICDGSRQKKAVA